MKKSAFMRAYDLYARLFVYVKPFWPMLLLGLLANILASGIDAGFTYLMRPFLDQGLIQLDMVFVRQIPLIILLGVTIRGFTTALGNYCMTWVARSVVNVMRRQVFAHILRLPANYYDEASSGQLLSKILYNIEQVAQVSADALTDLVQNVCLVIGLLIVMFAICWQLSLLFLLAIPLVGVLVNYTNKRVRKISHRVQQAMEHVTEIVSEAIEGYRVVRLFGGTAHEIKQFNQATERSRQQDMKVAMSKSINVFGVQCIIAVVIALIIVYSIQMASVIHVTAGAFLAIIAAMLQLIKPIKTLASLNATFQRGLAGAESVFSLLDESGEPTEGQSLAVRSPGELEFKNVSFAYRSGPPVLHAVNFKLHPGQVVALVGHSGSGKTTISSLIARFYEVNAGAILLDGVPIQHLSLAYLRSQIAMVNQHVTLFNDTVLHNIAYGSEHASREAVMHAAQLAYADEFIERLPQGYDTRIGEKGVLLSGGQRQRIAIARAILKDAPLLILDEATSALDTESERYIQRALEYVMQNRSTLVIAHRLSTIVRADTIIVLHAGRVVEQGTHATLIQQQGHYAKFCQTQELVITALETVDA
ncbi:MAG: lipid A export permease/ATP-binding protein MsbA [Legionella sp. 21-45-4]|nr:MAG: lipid A export permease/ATP-binding protein MsbA [Legionella sp. 21-45-4]